MSLNIDSKKKCGFNLAEAVPYIIATIFALITILPFFTMFVVSFREKDDFLSNPIALPKTIYFNNYISVAKQGKVLLGYQNSFIIAITVLVLVIIFGSLSAYALTKMQFSKAKMFSLLFLTPMIFPVYATIIPLYIGFFKMHLVNLYGVILIDVAISLPLTIFILTSFMNTLPYQLSESAIIDGASHFTIYLKIVLPLIRSAVASCIILTVLPVWNDFFLPLVMLGNPMYRTLPIIVNDYFNLVNQDYTKVTALITLMVAPVIIVYILLQKQFIKGITEGSLKG